MAVDWDLHVLQPLLKQFGEDVQPTYMPAIGAPYAIDGVFDRAFKQVVIHDDGPAMNTVAPVLGVRIAQFAAFPLQGDRLLIPAKPAVGRLTNVTYVINNVEPDGLGWLFLRLNKVSG